VRSVYRGCFALGLAVKGSVVPASPGVVTVLFFSCPLGLSMWWAFVTAYPGHRCR